MRLEYSLRILFTDDTSSVDDTSWRSNQTKESWDRNFVIFLGKQMAHEWSNDRSRPIRLVLALHPIVERVLEFYKIPLICLVIKNRARPQFYFRQICLSV